MKIYMTRAVFKTDDDNTINIFATLNEAYEHAVAAELDHFENLEYHKQGSKGYDEYTEMLKHDAANNHRLAHEIYYDFANSKSKGFDDPDDYMQIYVSERIIKGLDAPEVSVIKQDVCCKNKTCGKKVSPDDKECWWCGVQNPGVK